MAEASLLCINCLAPPPEGLPKWQCCVRCAKEKLPATYYCSEKCQAAHWPKHKLWHTAQKERVKELDLAQDKTIEQLIKQLWSGSADEQAKAAGALVKLAESSADSQGAIARAGGVEPLAALVQRLRGSVHAQAAAAAALDSLAADNADN